MKDVATLTWLPETLGQALSERLNALLLSTSQAWGIAAPTAAVATVLDSSHPQETEGAAPDGLDLGQPCAEPMRHWLATKLFSEHWRNSAIATAALQTLLQALQVTLHDAFGSPGAFSRERAGLQAGHRGIRLQWRWCDCSMHMLLTPGQLSASGWLKPVRLPELRPVDLGLALAQVPVTLRATLGTIELQLADWMDLAPGDVLMTRTPLSRPAQVHETASDWRYSARLGAHPDGNHRALQWTAS